MATINTRKDKDGFELKGNELQKVSESPDVYFPSPDRVLQLSEESKFKQKMGQEGKNRVIEQFNTYLQHFQLSYQKDKDGKWLEWDLPKIVSKIQVKM